MFHVERYPVEIAPAAVRRAGHEPMHLGIDDLQRQCRRQRRRPAAAFAIDPYLEACGAIAHADARLALAVFDPAEQHERLFAVAY